MECPSRDHVGNGHGVSGRELRPHLRSEAENFQDEIVGELRRDSAAVGRPNLRVEAHGHWKSGDLMAGQIENLDDTVLTPARRLCRKQFLRSSGDQFGLICGPESLGRRRRGLPSFEETM
jgi:hypothetical protein